MKAKVMSRESAIVYTPDNECLISISTPFVNYETHLPTEGWYDRIQFQFHDAAKSIPGIEIVLFDNVMASIMLEYIRLHHGRDFVIHCDAGMSRSVGVGVVLRDFFGYNVTFEVGTDQHRNSLVTSLLSRKMWFDELTNNI
jgi:predicted protein tyrosine phosphatase